MAPKGSCWFGWISSFFLSNSKSKSEKPRKWRWFFGGFKVKQSPAIVTPNRTLEEAMEEQRKHTVTVAITTAAAAEAAVAAANAAAEVVRLTGASRTFRLTHRRDPKLAAVRIQTAFRAYLARKALRALKGVARLQAVAGGHVARRRILPKARRKPPSNGNKELSRAKREPEAVTKETKDEFNSPRNWDRRSYLKPEIEASWLRNEAVDKWGRMKKYSYSFQEGRRNPQMTEEWMMMPIKDRGRRSCRLKQPPPPAEPTSSNGDNKPERATGRKTVFSDHTAGEIHLGEALNIITPRSLPRRSFCQVKRLSVAVDDSNLPCSLVFPTYMAITESARAKSRSMSTPRQRIGHLDACN